MRLSERIYRILLKAYPRRYQERYQEPMAQLFSDQLQAATGARPLVRLWMRTLIDLFLTVPARYFDRLRGRIMWNASPSAMRTIFFARYTAAGLGHAEITAEDILAGLLRESREIRDLLRREALDKTCQAIIGHAAMPGRNAASLQMPLSNTAKEILSLASREAEQTGAKKITPRHLAAGILGQGHTLAADLLLRNGIDLDRLRIPPE